MTRRFLDDLLATSFKYFFDADFHTILHSLTLVLALLAAIKLVAMWVRNEWQEGIRTIKHDITSVKIELTKATTRLNGHEQIFSGYSRNYRTANRQEHERMAS